MENEQTNLEKFTQNTMIIPDRYVREAYSNSPFDQFRKKLFAPLKGKERVVNFVGYESQVAYAMKTFQDKIDRGQHEREEWLGLNGTEKDILDIEQKIRLEKMRVNTKDTIKRLERELSIVRARLKTLQS
jgi:hypothetical protein